MALRRTMLESEFKNLFVMGRMVVSGIVAELPIGALLWNIRRWATLIDSQFFCRWDLLWGLELFAEAYDLDERGIWNCWLDGC